MASQVGEELAGGGGGGDWRDAIPPARFDLVGHHHEWRRIICLKVIAGTLRQDGGAERPEWLAILDAAVQDILHVVAARVGEDATIAEGARTEFHASLEPSDHLPLSNLIRRAGDQLILIQLVPACAGLAESGPDVGIAVLGAVVDVAHYELARLLQNLILDIKGGANGCPGIVSGGLGEHVAEMRLFSNYCLCDAD